jgi:hypothetical protein
MGPLLGPIVISTLPFFACGSSTGVAPDAAIAAVVDASVDASSWPWLGHEEAGAEVLPAADAAAAQAIDAAADRAVDLGVDHVQPMAYPRPSYTHLAETGIFSDPATRTLNPNLVPFAPTHVLWADGAGKRRWIMLPPGTQIDTRDIDHWAFPIGTKFFKEFSLDGKMLETRLVERYGPGREDYWMGAFVWNAEQTDAVFAVDGQSDLLGTLHDAPAQKQCWSCHLGEPGHGLGFSAMQLAGAGPGIRLQELVEQGLLSNPPARTDFHPPGDPVVAAALGYLHANCGHCHNPNGTSWPDTQMNLRLDVASATPEETGAYKTAIGQRLQSFRSVVFTTRIVAGQPDMSELLFRMKSRGSKDQMPPLATEIMDPTGVDVIQRWIAALK